MTQVDYQFDTFGNLREVKAKTMDASGKEISGAGRSVSYAYGNDYWQDRLTAVTVNGTTRTISYTASNGQGDYLNPANWYNGSDYTELTWTQGRRLTSLKRENASAADRYSYDLSGLRSEKVADGKRHAYVTQNGRVVRDTVTNAATGAFEYALDFTYDESGHPLTMRKYYDEAQTSYNTYHYVLNAQGDVVKLLHGPSKTVAEYSYDAWDRLLNLSPAAASDSTIAEQNPLRYRG